MRISGLFNYLKSVDYVYYVLLSGNILALTGDAAITWPSPVIPKLNSTENPLNQQVTEDEISWIASFSGYGSFISLLPFGFLPDLIGRKPCLLLIAIPHIISFVLSAFAKTVNLLYLSRFLSGFAFSSCYIVLPMYVAEISEDSTRGLMLVSFAVFSNFGSLLAYLTGPYMSMFWFNIFLSCFPICFFISFLLIAPESPYYHVMKKDEERALNVLKKLRSNVEKSGDELENIKDQVANSKRGSSILQTIKKKHAIKGSIIVILLVSFQQLSGYAVFMPYTQQIFIDAGSNIDSAISSIIVGCVAFLSSFLCPFVIDTRGRRFVLLISVSGIIVSNIIFGTYYYYSSARKLENFGWIPLFCLVMYMLFYTLGLGPLPLTVTSEILPVDIKFLMATISGFIGSICSILLSKNYFFLNETLGNHGTFFLFAGFSSFLLIFIIFFLPETKGKSFSEILRELDR